MPIADVGVQDLQELAGLALGGARGLLSTKKIDEPAFVEFVAGKRLSDAEMVHALARFPQLIRTPLIRKGAKLCLGFNEDQLAWMASPPVI